jgi:hypothetical protein
MDYSWYDRGVDGVVITLYWRAVQPDELVVELLNPRTVWSVG